MKSLPKSDIEYLTHHWPVVTGCSFGCPWCWARAAAKRFPKMHTHCASDPTAPLPFFFPTTHPDRLDLPLRRKKPARIGVCFTGDLFDPAVPDDFIVDVFEHMSTDILQPCRHTYLVLTKRASRMREFFSKYTTRGTEPWPNLYLGVSVTDPDEWRRVLDLQAIPATNRWISLEPLLQDMGQMPLDGISWVVVGSIDRPTAQYPAPKREWIDSIVDQCRIAGVPVWVKNNAQRLSSLDGCLPGTWPQELPGGCER